MFKGLFWITVCYLLTLLLGYWVMELTPGSFLLRVALSDLAMTVLVFGFSLFFRNASMYDPYWSVIPIFYAGWGFLNYPGSELNALILVVTGLWGLRLTLNWARGWKGLEHEDWRYVELRDQNPGWWPIVNFGGIHLFPTGMVFLGMLPMLLVIPGAGQPLGFWAGFGTAMAVAGTILELIADEQMRRFKQSASGEVILRSGVWKYSRHPNYLGEILFWTGLFFLTLNEGFTHAWSGLGFVSMLALFLGISIPMMDRKNLRTKAGYAEHIQKVPALFPFRVR